MKAHLIFLSQIDNDLHGSVFKFFQSAGVKDFLHTNPDRKSIVFHPTGTHIIVRTVGPIPNIPSVIEELNVEVGSKISGLVTLNRDRQMLLPADERQALVEQLGRPLTYMESHRYIRMREVELEEYVPRLLTRAGLSDIRFATDDAPLKYHRLEKCKKLYHSVLVEFTATVTDVEAFEFAWFNGIGRTKTYGFGMIRAGVVE